MQDPMERRKSFRMPFHAEVRIVANGQDFRGICENLSSAGLFLKTEQAPPLGAECDIEIIMNGRHSSLKIEKLQGLVVRQEEFGVGVEFTELLEWVALIPIYYNKVQEGKFR